MKIPVTSSSFSWCSSPDKSIEFDYSEHDMPQTRHQMPKEMGEGWFQSLHLPMNMIIRRGHMRFKPEMSGVLLPVASFTENFREPVLSVQATRKGHMILVDHKHQQDFIFGQNNCLFEHIEVRDTIAKLDASSEIEMTTLIISDSLLKELLGEDHSKSLLAALRITPLPSISVNKIPQHLNALLHSSISDHLTGHIAKLHTQAKVLDYISSLFQYSLGMKSTYMLSSESNIQERLQQLHSDLLKLEGKVPSLNELSKQYSLSLGQLKDGFKKIYGKSVFNYVTEVRLNDAHAALLNTDVPMKTLSKNLGYSHVNHFITAFGKQFGYPPGQLRKKKTNKAM